MGLVQPGKSLGRGFIEEYSAGWWVWHQHRHLMEETGTRDLSYGPMFGMRHAYFWPITHPSVGRDTELQVSFQCLP